MIYTVLLILLAVTLVYFLYALVKGITSSTSKNSTKTPKDEDYEEDGGDNAQKEEISVKIRREPDGIHIIVPAVIEDDDFDDVFPHIINDTPPDDHGLDMAFFRKVASLPEIANPDERERITSILADNGIISQENASILAMLTPPSEEGGEDASAAQPEAPNPEQPHEDTPEPEVADPMLPPIPEPEPADEIPEPQIVQPENTPVEGNESEEEDDGGFSEHDFKF